MHNNHDFPRLSNKIYNYYYDVHIMRISKCFGPLDTNNYLLLIIIYYSYKMGGAYFRNSTAIWIH